MKKNNKKSNSYNKKRQNSIKKIAELKFKFDIKTIFIIFFVSFFIFFIVSSFTQELKKALPEKSITSMIRILNKKKLKKLRLLITRYLQHTKMIKWQ